MRARERKSFERRRGKTSTGAEIVRALDDSNARPKRVWSQWTVRIPLRKWTDGILKLVWGAFLALTSLYCLLAFLPYTYYALIKSPAYSWMPFFAQHNALLFWLTSLGAAVAFRGAKNRIAIFTSAAVLLCAGIFLSVRPFLAGLESNRAAYWGSLASLWIVIFVVGLLEATSSSGGKEDAAEREASDRPRQFSYSTGVALAIGIALVSSAGAHIRNFTDTKTLNFGLSDSFEAFWSVVSHIFVAVLLVSLVNVIGITAAKFTRPRRLRRALLAGLVFVCQWILYARFLGNALSFAGWHAQVYAASLAAALTLLGYSIVEPFIARTEEAPAAISLRGKVALIAVCVSLAVLALALPTLVGGGDWNGLYQGAFTVVFWIGVSACVFRLWGNPKIYSLKTVFAVLMLSLVLYKGLEITQLFWAKPLGKTEDDIQRSIENYAARDASFNLAYRLLGNGRTEDCGDLCRILREYTEIRDARTQTDLKLVDHLVPARGERPNIFLLVIDSLRPDYLGAYNAKATFTPNLDAFARDSAVVRNVFTPYAGTSLSEPAIWAGALLLHAHFLQPFERVNGLEKLAKVDGYQMMVSDDEILSQILSPSDDLIKLDTDKKLWNQVEICSTARQAENALEHRSEAAKPIFFYTQPKNVHQFAHNDLPRAKESHWPAQAGFNYRISFEVHQVDECLGSFFSWMKLHGLYDNSIIIVTSDHGDATGEFGRTSHSLVIYPEIMRVPLIVHLPKAMQGKFVHDDNRISALIDIAPSLYYLVGRRPIVTNPLFGHPLFAESEAELHRYHRDELFLASDVHAAYGILGDNGKFLYTTYDSPARSELYDLERDPNAQHNVVTPLLKREYDERVIEYLHQIADFYGYKPGIGSLLAATH